MPRVVHFEIPVDDPERAVAFYQDVFGWKIEKWDSPFDYWLVTTGAGEDPGIDGGITRRGDIGVTTNTVDVDDIDKYVGRVVAAGGTVLAPKTAVPGVGYLAYCVDPDGNFFGLMQADENAA